jgi:glycosyltransferase involved in cell wall biosynthesis
VTLKVLHVTSSAQRRGAETFAADLVAELERSGIRQEGFVLHPRDMPPSDGRSRPTPTSSILRLDARSLARFRDAVESWEPDIIQAHGGEAFKYASLRPARSRVPVVYRRIGAAPTWIRKGPRRVGHAALMRRAARIVTVAEWLRAEAVEHFGVDPARVVTIPNGVDAARLTSGRRRADVRASLDIDDSAPVLLTLGALTWEKDPLAHLAVAERVLRRVEGAVHIFAGDGALRSRLDDAAARSPVRERIRVLGYRSDVGDVLAASDVLVFASRADGMEGMPAALIEAGLAGVPVAAYDVAGVPEVVADGRTGLLARSGDIEDLSRAALTLVLDAEGRRRMAREARVRCEEFDIRRIAPRYLDVYDAVARTEQSAASMDRGRIRSRQRAPRRLANRPR